jgi:hypothetical protein
MNAQDGVPWTDPVVWTSGGLFLWLAAALVFNLVYKPARQGQKVAYLTVASFVFLGMVLGVVWFAPTDHANPRAAAQVEQPLQGSDKTIVGFRSAKARPFAERKGTMALVERISARLWRVQPPGGAA